MQSVVLCCRTCVNVKVYLCDVRCYRYIQRTQYEFLWPPYWCWRLCWPLPWCSQPDPLWKQRHKETMSLHPYSLPGVLVLGIHINTVYFGTLTKTTTTTTLCDTCKTMYLTSNISHTNTLAYYLDGPHLCTHTSCYLMVCSKWMSSMDAVTQGHPACLSAVRRKQNSHFLSAVTTLTGHSHWKCVHYDTHCMTDIHWLPHTCTHLTREAGGGVHPFEQLSHAQLLSVIAVTGHHYLTHFHLCWVDHLFFFLLLLLLFVLIVTQITWQSGRHLWG